MLFGGCRIAHLVLAELVELFQGVASCFVEFVAWFVGLCQQLAGRLAEMLFALFKERCQDAFEIGRGGISGGGRVTAGRHEPKNAFFFGGIQYRVDQAEQ